MSSSRPVVRWRQRQNSAPRSSTAIRLSRPQRMFTEWALSAWPSRATAAGSRSSPTQDTRPSRLSSTRLSWPSSLMEVPPSMLITRFSLSTMGLKQGMSGRYRVVGQCPTTHQRSSWLSWPRKLSFFMHRQASMSSMPWAEGTPPWTKRISGVRIAVGRPRRKSSSARKG